MYFIYKLIVFIALVTLFGACSNDNQGSFDTGLVKVTVSSCNTYTTVYKGDLLVKDTSTSVVEIVHSSDGSKKVCVSSGAAHIIRGN